MSDAKLKYTLTEQQRRTLVLCLECVGGIADIRLNKAENKFDSTAAKIVRADVDDLLEIFNL